MSVLGPRFCARAFSNCGKRGPLLIAVRGPLTIAASLVAEHRLQTRRLSSCGSRAQPLRGTWDPPGPGHEPVSPALAGGLPTAAPPGKPQACTLNHCSLLTPDMAPNTCTHDGITSIRVEDGTEMQVLIRSQSLLVLICTTSGWARGCLMFLSAPSFCINPPRL